VGSLPPSQAQNANASYQVRQFIGCVSPLLSVLVHVANVWQATSWSRVFWSGAKNDAQELYHPLFVILGFIPSIRRRVSVVSVEVTSKATYGHLESVEPEMGLQ
jgi:hypothetical protein